MHRSERKRICVWDDGDRVARERADGEYVDEIERKASSHGHRHRRLGAQFGWRPR